MGKVPPDGECLEAANVTTSECLSSADRCIDAGGAKSEDVLGISGKRGRVAQEPGYMQRLFYGFFFQARQQQLSTRIKCRAYQGVPVAGDVERNFQSGFYSARGAGSTSLCYCSPTWLARRSWMDAAFLEGLDGRSERQDLLRAALHIPESEAFGSHLADLRHAFDFPRQKLTGNARQCRNDVVVLPWKAGAASFFAIQYFALALASHSERACTVAVRVVSVWKQADCIPRAAASMHECQVNPFHILAHRQDVLVSLTCRVYVDAMSTALLFLCWPESSHSHTHSNSAKKYDANHPHRCKQPDFRGIHPESASWQKGVKTLC